MARLTGISWSEALEMHFNSVLIDKKIKGINIGLDLTIGEYLRVSESILESNPFQRRQVTSRGKPYALLRRDLIDGCVMPPIILAVTENVCRNYDEIISRALSLGSLDELIKVQLHEIVKEAFYQKDLMILDGLQRTYTIQSSLSEIKHESPEKTGDFLNHLIRAEVYIGLSRIGILYRMLTLNTTQTPMSFRQQIEIMYHDYLDADNLPDGIKVLKEIQEKRARGAAKYKYSDVVDMYYAFTTGKPQSLDRQALVHQLAELDFIEGYKTDTEDLLHLLVCYNRFVRHLENLSDDWTFPARAARDDMPDRPFGLNIASIFQKVQPMTAFGAEAKRLLAMQKVSSIKEICDVVDECVFGAGNSAEALDDLVIIIDQVSKKAPKIGPAQRELFQFSFRYLLNPESSCYKDLSGCWLQGQEKYVALNSDEVEP
eukprot:TRINITY_DN68286_c0_g1_i1.p1 TRINITY_DN68286_c0_g1~~TRINITY_DN68286_c0_g1_i1.p1  ORF type:complete len:430 (+),score=21.82 TRINITY_DN68286_c0_g1_i1:128-1417(+)